MTPCPFSTMAGEGNPGCKAPMSCKQALTARKSWRSRYASDFFFRTNTGVFQGLVEGSRWPICTSLCTNSTTAARFSSVLGHCSTLTGLSVSQVSFKGRQTAVAFIKNPWKGDIPNDVGSSAQEWLSGPLPPSGCTTPPCQHLQQL